MFFFRRVNFEESKVDASSRNRSLRATTRGHKSEPARCAGMRRDISRVLEWGRENWNSNERRPSRRRRRRRRRGMEEWDEQKEEGRGNKSAQKGTDRADRVHKLPTEMRSPPLLPSPFHPLKGMEKNPPSPPRSLANAIGFESNFLLLARSRSDEVLKTRSDE